AYYENAELLIRVNIVFSSLRDGIKGILSFKTLNSGNEMLKAMSFAFESHETTKDESFIKLVEEMVKKLLDNYKGEADTGSHIDGFS
ncbi:MAG: hypothetical protein HQK84_12920, partial [Nitrospinae bacterium]|nr:hypothetical protein [Nitrospinota bacterium]